MEATNVTGEVPDSETFTTLDHDIVPKSEEMNRPICVFCAINFSQGQVLMHVRLFERTQDVVLEG